MFDQENITQRQVEGPGPDVQAAGGLDELHGDAHLVARAAQGSRQHVGGVQLSADFAHIGVRSLECKRRCAHLQRGNVRQPVGGSSVRPSHSACSFWSTLMSTSGRTTMVGNFSSGGPAWNSLPGIFQATTEHDGRKDAAESPGQTLEGRSAIGCPAPNDGSRFEGRGHVLLWQRRNARYGGIVFDPPDKPVSLARNCFDVTRGIGVVAECDAQLAHGAVEAGVEFDHAGGPQSRNELFPGHDLAGPLGELSDL